MHLKEAIGCDFMIIIPYDQVVKIIRKDAPPSRFHANHDDIG